MKTSNYIVFILLAVLAAACSKDDLIPDCPPPTDDVNGLIEMTFTAAAPETRTTLGEKDADGEYPVLWSGGDAMAVVPTGESYGASDIETMKFTTSIEGGTAASATFTGSTYASDGGYAAFYPHCNLTSYNGNMYNNVFYFTLPAEQDAVPGSFAPNLCPAFVLTEGNVENLSFSPLCGLVKFSLSGDVVSDLASVRFEAAGQPLTGELGCNAYYRLFDNNTSPISHVTLTGTFVAGDDYYMVVVPCSLDGGFSFTFTKEDGSVYVKEGKIDDGYIIMGQISNFGNIDLSEATFDISGIDPKFVAAVEEGSNPKIKFETTDGKVIPTDKNKELMASVTELNISSKGLTDASALKYFTGLQTLNCSGNNLEELDVSGLKSLTELNCTNSKVMILTVNGATALAKLDCSVNSLTKLDVSELKNLTYLNCVRNIKLMELTVTGATALETLDCSMNRLTELEVGSLTNLTSLTCDINQLTELEVGSLTKLTSLTCCGNQLTELNVSGLTALKSLSCSENMLTTLDVSGLTNLTYLDCYYNQLTELEVGSLTNLTSLTCSNNQLTTLDVSELTNLTSLACGNNQLTTLNVNALTELTTLSCYGNRLTTLDISALSDLREIYCGKQTSDGTTQQTLTLTLTDEQEAGVWAQSLEDSDLKEYNNYVDLKVK